MAHYSLGVFQQFKERVGGECGFHCTGFLVLVPAADRAGLEANMALQRKVGIRTDLLAPDEIRATMPGLDTHDLVAAAYEPESGYADPYLTVNAYAQAARRHGATFYINTEVTGIRFAGGKVVGVDTTAGAFDAPLVVNCAGAWGARIAKLAGVQAPINACRVQVAFFRRPPEPGARAPGGDRLHPCRLLPTGNGQPHPGRVGGPGGSQRHCRSGLL